jgi:hypothetical protein
MLPKSSQAQAAANKRFIVMHVPEGMWNGASRPAEGAATFGPIFSPLDSFRAKLTMLNGLNLRSRDKGPGGDGHHRGVSHMLTCTEMADASNAGGPSIDQKIATAIAGDATFKSLQFAVRIIYNDTNATLVWEAARKRLPAMQSPYDAYARIFGMPEPAPTGGPAPLDLRKSALDHALAEITTLRGKLGTTDRERLDSYQESLRAIEKRLSNLPTGAECVRPDLGTQIPDVKAEKVYPEVGKLQMDLMVAALRCNVTRVASFQWGNSNDQCSYSWLGINKLGHDLAHSTMSAQKQTVFNWYAKQFAYLLGELEKVPEGEGTMLDNTVVLWVSEFSESDGHKANDLLWLLAGNVNGFLKQGQVLKMNGRSVSDVHTTIGNAFGIPDKTFGNPAYGEGPIPTIIA